MDHVGSGIGVRTISCTLACAVFLLSSMTLRAQQTPDPVLAASQSLPLLSFSSSSSGRLTLDMRFKIYQRGLIGAGTLFGPIVGAAVGQWRDSPEKWGQGGGGYGRRLASGYARSLASSTIAFGVAAMDHEDPRFMSSHAGGIWSRTGRAIVGTFITHTDRSSAWMPAYSRFAGSYGAAFLANAWYPQSERNVGDVMERGSTALLSSIVWRVVKEFGPDIRKIVLHD